MSDQPDKRPDANALIMADVIIAVWRGDEMPPVIAELFQDENEWLVWHRRFEELSRRLPAHQLSGKVEIEVVRFPVSGIADMTELLKLKNRLKHDDPGALDG